MTTPTPPPGMEIWKLAGTISDERLPEGAVYWNDSATYPRWEEATSEYPRDWLTYAIPITHPATGDAKPIEQRQELPIPEAHYSCGGSCREDRSLPADDLAWFPKVKLWLCSECSEDQEEFGDAEITLEDYLNTRK